MTLQAPKRISRPAPYLRNKPGTRAQIADALTGHFITRGAPTIVEQTPAHMTKPGYLEATGNLIATPLTLHQHTPEGRLGGLAYAVMMARYLDLGLREQQHQLSMQERLALIAWWDSAYGVTRVRRGLIEQLSKKLASVSEAETEADHIVLAVVSCHREQAEPEAIAPRFGETGDWLRRRVDWCMRLANRRSGVGSSVVQVAR